MLYNIYLIRHARTESNYAGLYAGSADEPVSPKGFLELAAKIRSGYYPRVQRVYSSPRQRCRQTAEFIYPEHNITIVPGFDEYNFGEFEGKSYRELKDNPAYQRWVASGGKEKAPGGEDIESYKGRCCRAFEQVVEEVIKDGIQDTALVIHGGTIMAIMVNYAPGTKSFYDWQVANTQGYKLVIADELWQKEKMIKSCQFLDT